MSSATLDPGASPHASTVDWVLAPLLTPAYRLAYGLLRNREEAEDAVQEAALSAWKHRYQFRAGADPRPWFFAIVANRCRSYRRSPWGRLMRQADPQVRADSGAAADFEGDLDLRRALNRLRYDDRLALVLRYYMDLSFEDVAATLGVSEEAARSRTQRAVRRLRPHVGGLEEGTDV